MAEIKEIERAKEIFELICAALDSREWKYQREEEDMVIHFGVRGDDIPMRLVIHVDADRQMIRMMSPIGFNMSEDKRIEGAIATCAASFSLVDGSFDYDISDGKIVFRATQSYRDSQIGEETIQYMLSMTCSVVDEFNDKFLALSKGMIDIADFLKEE